MDHVCTIERNVGSNWMKKYAHVHLWTRDPTAGVKSSFCTPPAGCVKGNTHVHIMDSHKKYFSLQKSTSINKRVDIIIHTMENSNNTSMTVPAPAKRIDIGHGIGGTNFPDIMARLAKMQDRWVSDDRPVCHHPILRPVKSVIAKRSTYVDVTYYREFLT